MNRMFGAVIAVSALGVAAGATATAGPVEDRQELMKSVGKSIKLSVQMVKGEIPYDAAAAAAAMQTINGVPGRFEKLFPAGSDLHPKTAAARKIWEDMKGFLAKSADMKAASAKAKIAAGQGQAAFKAAIFGSVLKTCKACHDAYRIKRN